MPTSTDIAFSPAVKAVQTRRGSRDAYARLEAKGGWATKIDANLAAFICEQRSFYLATASRDGQPYIQHRGGPPGFLRVLDQGTLGFTDFRGNRQYITVGNLQDNPRAFIFVMDYATGRRVKIWGHATVVEADAELVSRLFPSGYRAKAELAILFTVAAWDVNCPQHIPRKFTTAQVSDQIAHYETRIAKLEAELAAAKQKT